MEKFAPLRENAIVARPTEFAKTKFVQSISGGNTNYEYTPSVKSHVSKHESHKSGHTVKSLSIALGEEKKKRKQLEGEVSTIKNQLTTLYNQLAK